MRYCQTEPEHRCPSTGPWSCSQPGHGTQLSDKGGQHWQGCLQSGVPPAPRGPGQGNGMVWERGRVSPGTGMPLQWFSPDPYSAHLSPEVHVVLGTNLCSVCRSEHANPSDMRRSCSAEHKERAQDQLTRTALPPGLALKPIVLVLPV